MTQFIEQTHFLPRSEPEQTIWLGNYKNKIANYGLTLGLTAEQVTAQQTLADDIIERINTVAQAKSSMANLVSEKDTFKKQQVQLLRATANSMKANSNYTDNIGKDLGIFGEAGNIDADNVKPSIKAQATADGVKVSFNKKGLTGVKVYSRLKGTSAWTFLGVDLHSPYLDSRPVANGTPETREYMVRGIIGDDEVGVPSDITSTVFEGAVA